MVKIIIQNGKVINRIECGDNFVLPPEMGELVNDVPGVDIGWTLSDGVYSPPIVIPQIDPAAIRKEAMALFTALPIEVRAPFIPAWAAVNNALELGDKAGAIAYLETLAPQAAAAGQSDAFAAIVAKLQQLP